MSSQATSVPSGSLPELLEAARLLLSEKAVIRFDEPVQLASGQMSSHFIDGKAGLAQARDLRLACHAINALVVSNGIDFDAVGGLTLGADHLGVGVALEADKQWFFVRKQAKERGTARSIEGAALGPGVKVLIVEDVVSTGGSLLQAVDAVASTGATVVAAATLVDRGGNAGALLEQRDIPYFFLGAHTDFGLPPVAPAASQQ